MSQPYPFPPGYVPPMIADATARYVVPQPAPKNEANAKPLWPTIIEETETEAANLFRIGTNANVCRSQTLRELANDMRAQHEFGVAKYGVPLVAKNDRDHLVDAYQELLDGIVYLRAEIEKRGGIPTGVFAEEPIGSLVRIYQRTYEIVVDLRTIIAERDGR